MSIVRKSSVHISVFHLGMNTSSTKQVYCPTGTCLILNMCGDDPKENWWILSRNTTVVQLMVIVTIFRNSKDIFLIDFEVENITWTISMTKKKQKVLSYMHNNEPFNTAISHFRMQKIFFATQSPQPLLIFEVIKFVE